MSLFKGLYQEKHKDNRIFINAKKINYTCYRYNKTTSNNDSNDYYCQNLKISFELYHSIVPENNPCQGLVMSILPEYRVLVREFHFPLRLFSSAAEAETLVHVMLGEIPIPFNIEDQGEDQLRWIDNDRDEECSLSGIDDVAARVSKVAERISGEIRRSSSLELAEMSIVIRKRTVVAPERYRAMVLPDYDDDGDD